MVQLLDDCWMTRTALSILMSFEAARGIQMRASVIEQMRTNKRFLYALHRVNTARANTGEYNKCVRGGGAR